MSFNSDKFECLRYWPRNSEPDFSYTSPDGAVIEEKEHLRDLGVEMASDLTFSVHISNTVAAANQLIGWALRTFRRRSRLIMLTIWKSLVQSKLDYTSQLWSPSDQASISELESVARHFTARVDGMAGLDYWERLHSLHLYSQERKVPDYLPLEDSPRVGTGVQGYLPRVISVAPLCSQAPSAVKMARESSLQVKGAQPFNLIPRELRDISTGSPEMFKSKLDECVSSIPDQPAIPILT